MPQQFLAHYFHYFIYFLIILLFFLLYKTYTLRELFIIIKENKLFFILLSITGLTISLSNFPFEPLVHYDDQTYVVEAQNIIENNINSICNINENGKCLLYSIAPHGVGISSIYSLLYNYDFDLFFRKISMLNLIFYLLNSVLIFIIAENIFRNKNISRMSAILIITVPYNIIFSTSVAPATIANTLFLISIFALVKIFEKKSKNYRLKKYFLWLLWVSLIILSSLRVEYAVLLGLLVLIILIKFVNRFKNKTKSWVFLKNTFIEELVWNALIILTFVSYINSFFYAKQKLYSGLDPAIGPAFVNFSYFYHYVSNIAFIILTVCLIYYFFVFIKNHSIIRENKNAKNLEILLIIIFFLFIFLYTFYNFPSVFRFIIPITSIYILFSAAGLNMIIYKIVKNKKWVPIFSIFAVLIMSLFFVDFALKEKNKTIEINERNAYFIKILNNANLDLIENNASNKLNFYFKGIVLGHIPRIKNYMNDDPYAMKKLQEGNIIYYINTPFESIYNSYFNDAEKFSHKIVVNDTKYNFNIYQVKLKSGTKVRN